MKTVGSFTKKFWFAKCNMPQKWTNFVRVEVFTSVVLWIQAFLDVILLCWLSGSWHFFRLQCLHLQGSSVYFMKMKALQSFITSEHFTCIVSHRRRFESSKKIYSLCWRFWFQFVVREIDLKILVPIITENVHVKYV